MKIKNINNIAVVGAGTMGHGIAQVCAEAGYRVSLIDIEDKIVKNAKKRIELNLKKLVQSRVVDKAKVQSTLSLILPTIDMSAALTDVDIIFEAIPENMDLKKNIWLQINKLCSTEPIMVTNTSSLSITELALVTLKPDKFIGGHWMLPPYLRPLVEIIRGVKTSDATVNFMKNFFKSLGKIVVVCKDSPGFIVNRMQAAMLREAISLVEQDVCNMESIDLVWTKFLGQRYCLEGPFQFIDRSGLDTWLSIFQYLNKESEDNKFKPPDSLIRKVKAGDFGLKTGKGFYNYSGKMVENIIDKRDKQMIDFLKKIGFYKDLL